MNKPVRLLFALGPLVVFVALMVLFAGTINRDPSYVPSALIDKPAPKLALPPLQGSNREGFGPADFAGQVTVVNVFASWCVPCRAEHPLLTQLAQQGIPVFGMNHKDPADQALAFLQDLGNPYSRIGVDADGQASIEWGVYGVPETFVVDGAGTITYKHVGPLSQKAIDNELLPQIEQARARFE